MTFASKANYAGPFDANGIPMLDYRGKLGCQYNPIAVAQYGLGNFNLLSSTGHHVRLNNLARVADWLVSNLQSNPAGLHVWMHNFDWEYRETLRAPWYSALAQGQGISLLVRAFRETRNSVYMESARQAFAAFLVDVKSGGVAFRDEEHNWWCEEYIVFPPTHILNGFIWAIWGIYDFWLASADPIADSLFKAATATLRRKLIDFDAGYWSLYEQSGTLLPMIASSFYHSLHIVQLTVMYRLTGDELFAQIADRWHGYQKSWLKKKLAFMHKVAFKLLYY